MYTIYSKFKIPGNPRSPLDPGGGAKPGSPLSPFIPEIPGKP